MRMDHPFILDFCQNLTFCVVATIIFNFLGKTHFLQVLSYFNSFVYLRFKYGRPHIIIIISKWNSYFKIRTCVCGCSSQGFSFVVFYVSWLKKCNMLSFRDHLLKHVIFCQIWHQISFRKDCYLNRKDY